ncbi:EscU/YscU/HrcU family type III secretion system export apparatus switch protein [Bacillus sp. HMF5848]|uniref:EscU/YscU/HrcU family type III secretion system export apparatus switch protein n=1 Tax=Bacillus sp. HMF5848 TaxID=2495421 RepID=UPI000F78895E|nr:EscU/YscU/HrcU family type III secretion system export apparatus switch protein [Bacillus sp. HMF5848]RSK27013.1 EscU/YscU/HrcU family type III secretion system export apparatus switch protein [Bacillus sp. HMF5848]
MNQNNRKQAVALSYNDNKNTAPIVVAKGKGIVAANLITKAKEHNIPIQEDSSLVELLQQIQIHEQIPEELYEVVAEIFAFVYQLDKKIKD